MIKKCAFFQCSNREECPDRNCSGCGGAAYQNCGCDACVNQSREGDGDIEICLVALDLREADMEDMEADSGKLYKNGNLEDKKIGAALRKAADDYEIVRECLIWKNHHEIFGKRIGLRAMIRHIGRR